jgi:hypothetical protein
VETIIASDIVFGTSKKINRELEDLPLQSHAAIINLLTTMMQHRQINEKVIAEQKQAEIQQRQMDMAEAERKRQADARALKESGLVIAR